MTSQIAVVPLVFWVLCLGLVSAQEPIPAGSAPTRFLIKSRTKFKPPDVWYKCDDGYVAVNMNMTAPDFLTLNPVRVDRYIRLEKGADRRTICTTASISGIKKGDIFPVGGRLVRLDHGDQFGAVVFLADDVAFETNVDRLVDANVAYSGGMFVVDDAPLSGGGSRTVLKAIVQADGLADVTVKQYQANGDEDETRAQSRAGLKISDVIQCGKYPFKIVDIVRPNPQSRVVGWVSLKLQRD